MNLVGEGVMGNCLRNQTPSCISGHSSVTPTSGTSTSKTSSSGTRFSSSTGDSRLSGSNRMVSGEERSLTARPCQTLPVPNLKEFTFTELKAATKGFRPDSLLGEGWFGRVFKGLG